MIRLLIIGGLLFWGYRKLKSIATPEASHKESGSPEAPGDVTDDVMVQDPYCKAYFPERQGSKLTWHGETRLFCSPKCRDRFVAERAASPPKNSETINH